MFMKRFLLIIALGLTLALTTSSAPQTPTRCNYCGDSGGVVVGYNYYGPVFGPCSACGGTGVVWVYSTPSQPSHNNNPTFRGDSSDGWRTNGAIYLTRVISKSKDKFDSYKKGSKIAVKYNGSYIVVNDSKFVKINNIDYYGI